MLVSLLLFQWVLVEQACNLYSLSIIPLYDTLGPEACVYIINQGKSGSISTVFIANGSVFFVVLGIVKV